MRTGIKTALLSSVFAVAAAGAGWAFDPIDSSPLVDRITAENIKFHQQRLQLIADKRNDNRAAGTPGYNASADYVRRRLMRAGYDVTVQTFEANIFEENTPAELARTAPDSETYEPGTEVLSLEFSGAGNVEGELTLAGGIVLPPTEEPSSQSGCSADDFSADTAGTIVLIQRGTCTFFEKATNAANAGAIGVVIFNEGNPGRTDVVNGTLGDVLSIPVVGTTFEIGNDLVERVQAGDPVRLRVAVDATTTPIETSNVLADLEGERNDRTVVVGAHLDSVEEGPGINDNGSGSGAILEIAEQFAALGVTPRNTVRFAFWGAEEQGLIGSTYYVSQLNQRALDKIALNLNFDMLSSRNYVRFVYDGDGDLGPVGPGGSDVIEKVFVSYFREQGLATEPTEFDGRSDYQAFINVGIPAGGLFSGAEGIKTPKQERIYGGQAGKQYDPCYHEPCDTIENVGNRPLEELGKGAAHSVYTFAMTKQDVRKAGGEQRVAGRSAAGTSLYYGPKLVR